MPKRPPNVIDLPVDEPMAHPDPAADTEEAAELAEFMELVRVVRESAEEDCIIDAMSIEQFKGDIDVDPPRE